MILPIRLAQRAAELIGRLGLALIVGSAMTATAMAETMVTLKGHVPSAIRDAAQVDNVQADERINLSLGMRLDQQKLDQAVRTVLTSPDPAHRPYLTSAQFAAQFGISERRQKLKMFAAAHGLTVDDSADQATSMAVKVHASAAQVEKAFGIRLHHYRGKDGKVFRAHDTDPQVEASAVDYLGGVFGLSNNSVAQPNVRLRPTKASPRTSLAPGTAGATPSNISGRTGPAATLSPTDVRQIYGLSSVTAKGTGQSVALIELDGYVTSDNNAYAAQFGFPTPPVSVLSTDGLGNLCGPSRDTPCTDQEFVDEITNGFNGMLEAALDLDMVISLAPALAHIYVYEGSDSFDGIYSIYNQIATDNTASVLSVSWNVGENGADPSFLSSENQVFQRMVVEGISVFVASGDNGSTYISDPSTQPFVTGVGGTQLDGTVQSPIETSAWNDAAGSSGGGISGVWPTPSYQTGLAGTASQVFRNVPDISLNASPFSPYGVYGGGQWLQVAGTSAAAPLWSAFTALVNQQRAAVGDGRLGFANTILYQLGTGASHATYFNDIATGSNGMFSAGPGYDNVTGLGSILNRGGTLLTALVPAPHDSTPPVVSISTPASGAVLKGIVTVSGTASDNVKVQSVQVLVDTTTIGLATGTTSWALAVNFNSIKNGAHTLTAKATDSSSNISSRTIAVSVINPVPTIHIAAPASGATLVGLVTISGTASSSLGIQSVQVLIDSQTLGVATGTTTWSYSFNSTLRTNGAHTLMATATDFSKNVSTGSIPVTINNTPPNPPTHLVFSAPAATSLQLTWTASTGTVVSAYHVDVSTSSSFVTFVAGYNNFNAGNVTTLIVSPLQASTTYYARARAYSATGSASVNSASASGVTTFVILNPPTHLVLTSPTVSSLQLTWTASTGPVVSAYHVDVSTLSSFATDLSGYTNFNAGNVTTLLVSGLQAGTTYYARARAYDSAGHSSVNSAPASGVTARAAGTASATFVKLDITTHGSWKGIFAADGEAIDLDTTVYPAYAQVTMTGATSYSWTNSTPDVRALEKAGAYDRLATAWYSSSTFKIDINLTDGASHQVALYALDWLSEGAQERVDILDATTLAVLDTRTLTSFSQGQYPTWTLKGHVVIKVTNLSTTLNGVISGIFFGTPAAPAPNAFVAGRALGTIRDNWSGWVGMKIQVGAKPLLVNALGRIAFSGNTQTHQVKLVSAATGQDIPGASVSVGPGGTPYQYKYVSLASTVTLAANAAYYVVTHEVNGGDYWYDDDTLLTSSVDGTIPSAIYSADTAPTTWNVSLATAHAYGPVDFIYKVSGAAVVERDLPSPVIASQTAVTSSDGLSASYDPSFVVQSFEWSVDDAAASDRTADLSGTEKPPVDQAASVVRTAASGSHGTLSPEILASRAGSTVIVHVTALLADGRRSPAASTTLSVERTGIRTSAIDSVVVYPNPYRAARGDTHITFGSLPNGSTVKLFTLSGHWIKTLGASGVWDLTNDSGDKVASGLYLYLIADPQGDKTRGKLAVIR